MITDMTDNIERKRLQLSINKCTHQWKVTSAHSNGNLANES